MQVKKQQLELDMEQQTGSKSGKEYAKAAYCHPAYLTYMQRTSCKMPGRMKHKLESRLPEKKRKRRRHCEDDSEGESGGTAVPCATEQWSQMERRMWGPPGDTSAFQILSQ